MGTILIILAVIAYLIYLLKMSKSDFFKQDKKVLEDKRDNLLIPLLRDFRFSEKEIEDFKQAYNYFMLHPEKFDGATIVADIYTIYKLDVSAMKHDYDYFTDGSFLKRLKHDVKYAENMRDLKVNWITAWGRCALLLTMNCLGLYDLRKLITKL